MSDLLAFVRQDLGPEVKRSGRWHYWRCPFHNEADASFGVRDDGKGWYCFGCDRGGDLIAYRVERGDLTPREAGELRNDGADEPKKSRGVRQWRREAREAPKPAPVRSTADAPPPAWQERARAFVDHCQAKLFDGDNEGLAHLRSRGLRDETMRGWGLGWHERAGRHDPGSWGLRGKRIYLPRGVVIPWTVDGATYHVKVRLFETWEGGAPKYVRIRGGTPTLYGLDHMRGKPTVVICEGELDAALLWQEAHDLVDVVAIGTKAAKTEPKGLARLLGASRWLVALDADADKEVQVWRDYSARVKRIRPLVGNDITDMHDEGGDLRAWIMYHLSVEGRLEATVAAREDHEQRRDAIEADALAEAEALLAGGLKDPQDRRRYAEIAQALGWPCWGMDWSDWGGLTPPSSGNP